MPHQDGGDGGVEEGVAGCDGEDGLREVELLRVLEQVAVGAGIDREVDEVVVPKGG